MHHVRRVVNFVRGMFRSIVKKALSLLSHSRVRFLEKPVLVSYEEQAQPPAQPAAQPPAQPAAQPPRRRRMTADRQIVAQVQLVLPAYPVQQLPAGVVRRSTRDRRPVERYQAVW